jgi:hypothetical protein
MGSPRIGMNQLKTVDAPPYKQTGRDATSRVPKPEAEQRWDSVAEIIAGLLLHAR